jgi:hypothetical protein
LNNAAEESQSYSTGNKNIKEAHEESGIPDKDLGIKRATESRKIALTRHSDD